MNKDKIRERERREKQEVIERVEDMKKERVENDKKFRLRPFWQEEKDKILKGLNYDDMGSKSMRKGKISVKYKFL
jgi:hypothetical protein